MFSTLSACLSVATRKDLHDRCGAGGVTAHDLRHTCAVSRLGLLREAGIGNEEAIQLLRSFFGWAKDSLMPNHYAEAHFEDRLKTVFAAKLDSRIAFLRQLRAMGRTRRAAAIARSRWEAMSRVAWAAHVPVQCRDFASLPPLPAHVRYMDEYDDSLRTIKRPDTSDTWMLLFDTFKHELDLTVLEDVPTAVRGEVVLGLGTQGA